MQHLSRVYYLHRQVISVSATFSQDEIHGQRHYSPNSRTNSSNDNNHSQNSSWPEETVCENTGDDVRVWLPFPRRCLNRCGSPRRPSFETQRLNHFIIHHIMGLVLIERRMGLFGLNPSP